MGTSTPDHNTTRLTIDKSSLFKLPKFLDTHTPPDGEPLHLYLRKAVIESSKSRAQYCYVCPTACHLLVVVV